MEYRVGLYLKSSLPLLHTFLSSYISPYSRCEMMEQTNTRHYQLQRCASRTRKTFAQREKLQKNADPFKKPDLHLSPSLSLPRSVRRTPETIDRRTNEEPITVLQPSSSGAVWRDGQQQAGCSSLLPSSSSSSFPLLSSLLSSLNTIRVGHKNLWRL